MLNGKFCAEAWDSISRYIYSALQGGSIMDGWTKDENMMIACCNDGTRPVIFKLERIDIPETEEEWLRVGTAWKNGKCVNQAGAYHDIEKAKAFADTKAAEMKTTYYVVRKEVFKCPANTRTLG